MNNKMLNIRQGYDLDLKIAFTDKIIHEFYRKMNGQIYCSFSGGKDSTVLVHRVRNLYPKTPLLFMNTGLEFPEIVEFVKTFENIFIVKPKMNFKKVIEKYGYPVVSKKISMGIDRYRNAGSVQKDLRISGGINPTSGKKQERTISKKWQYLIEAPFKISEKCCDIMKKQPAHRFEKETGLFPIVGTMASDSKMRKDSILAEGCNALNLKTPQSRPLAHWLEPDIWEYIKRFNLPYSSIYDMGYKRTGCMFCMFGCQFESECRFAKMKSTHPKIYKYCMENLGIAEPLKWIKARSDPEELLF